MDLNETVVFFLVQQRLAEARAAAARLRLVPPRAPAPGARHVLGAVLVRLGHAIAGERGDLALTDRRSSAI